MSYSTRKMQMVYVKGCLKKINKELEKGKITNENLKNIFSVIEDYFEALNKPKDKKDFDYDALENEVKKGYEKLIANEEFILAKMNYALANQEIHHQKLSTLGQTLFKSIHQKKFDINTDWKTRRYKSFIDKIYRIGIDLDYLLNIEGMIINVEDIALVKNILLVLRKNVSYEQKEVIERIEENKNLKELSKTYNKYKIQIIDKKIS